MADDILNRLKKHTIKGRKRINGRHRYCIWCDIIDEIEQQQAEIERLRAAGDALAHLMPHAHLSVPCRPPQGTPLDEWCSECAALAAWKEARRG